MVFNLEIGLEEENIVMICFVLLIGVFCRIVIFMLVVFSLELVVVIINFLLVKLVFIKLIMDEVLFKVCGVFEEKVVCVSCVLMFVFWCEKIKYIFVCMFVIGDLFLLVSFRENFKLYWLEDFLLWLGIWYVSLVINLVFFR